MAKDKNEECRAPCPVGRFFKDMEGMCGKHSQFALHLKQSRLEMLKAIRSLVDEKIEDLEKRGTAQKKVTKIKVE